MSIQHVILGHVLWIRLVEQEESYVVVIALTRVRMALVQKVATGIVVGVRIGSCKK